MKTQLWAIGLVIIATILGAFGPIFFKKAAHKFKLSIKALITNYNLLIGCALYGISTLFFVPALRGGELSVLYPFVALSYIWVSFLSIKMLNERMNKWKWVGIALIILGVSCIGLGS